MSFISAPKKNRFAADGLPARVALAVLASVGIIYANLAPVIVSGLAQSQEVSNEIAGYVFAVNMYGTAIGGFVLTFFITRIEWRRTAFVLLGLIIGADILSAFTDSLSMLFATRFLHGLVGGALIGVGFSVISRIRNPEVTFSVLIFVQLSLGGAGVAILMPLIPSLGMGIVWLSLVGFSILAIILVPFLDDYSFTVDPNSTEDSAGRAPSLVIIFTLVALFLFQAGEMTAFVYVIEIGISHLLDPDFVNISVAISLWIGGPAALLVTWWSLRSGRLTPILMGIIFTVGSISLLLVGESWAYMTANIGFGIFFSLTIPYLLGISSELDNRGAVAASAGFVSSLGLATGPAIAALILRDHQLTQVIYLSLAVLITSALLILFPARSLDRRSKHGHIQW